MKYFNEMAKLVFITAFNTHVEKKLTKLATGKKRMSGCRNG